MDEPDRPQPRRDVNAGRGMTVSVGRVREDPLFHIKLVATGHNTIRGAAGGSLLNAELLVATGLLTAGSCPSSAVRRLGTRPRSRAAWRSCAAGARRSR